MQTIVIANPKGGSGKTTRATNIAGWLAGKSQAVVLHHRDRQQTSTQWIGRPG
jgi:chromosome partitioning protein